MKIKQFCVGDVATNCYLVYDETTLEGAIVDPGDRADMLLADIEDKKIKLKYILLTHAHFDHILAVGALKKATGAQVVVSKEDEYLFDASASLSPFGAYGRQLMNRFDFPGADIWAQEGTEVTFGGRDIRPDRVRLCWITAFCLQVTRCSASPAAAQTCRVAIGVQC